MVDVADGVGGACVAVSLTTGEGEGDGDGSTVVVLAGAWLGVAAATAVRVTGGAADGVSDPASLPPPQAVAVSPIPSTVVATRKVRRMAIISGARK
jgi:hypothetical protein